MQLLLVQEAVRQQDPRHCLPARSMAANSTIACDDDGVRKWRQLFPSVRYRSSGDALDLSLLDRREGVFLRMSKVHSDTGIAAGRDCARQGDREQQASAGNRLR